MIAVILWAAGALVVVFVGSAVIAGAIDAVRDAQTRGDKILTIATALGLLLLVAGVVAGVMAVIS